MRAHSAHRYYRNKEELKKGKSGYELSLNGRWKFRYAKNLAEAPVGFERTQTDVSDWDEITVPAHIQMEGYGAPAYVNTQWPWDGHAEIMPPDIPVEENPVGSYVTFFDLPSDFREKDVIVSFQGAESAIAVWCNGDYVGYAEDSFMPSEFDLTPFVKKKRNRLAVQVFRFCSGSWFEDQDFFRFFGIYRDVILYCRPKCHVEDLKVETTLHEDHKSGTVSVTLCLQGGACRGGIRLYAPRLDRCALDRVKKTDETNTLLAQAAWMGGTKDIMSTRIDLKVEQIRLWSAEDPFLYTLLIEVCDEKGELLEIIPQKVGFRKFEIADGIMLLNGKRIVFKGVNRHEFTTEHGRVPDEGALLADLVTMKQNNINAIRTSHYPNDEMLYDLCDRFGFYLIAENNMETHGSWDAYIRGQLPLEKVIPGNQDEYAPLLLDRVKSCYERDKNHPSVLIWSIGNESYGGSVVRQMTDLFHTLDPIRPVHYEGVAQPDPMELDTTDINSVMYYSAAQIREFLNRHPNKPMISCEYSHAMGNACGAVDQYRILTEECPHYQGGFLWDYIDQSITKQDRYGRDYQAYGGDFDERPNDGNFSGNGIVYGRNRMPSPKMATVKYNYQDLFVRFGKDMASFTVENRSLFTPTSAYRCILKLEQLRDDHVSFEMATVYETEIETDVAPGEEASYPFPEAVRTLLMAERNLQAGDGAAQVGEFVLTLSFRLREDRFYAKAGHEVAYGEQTFSRDPSGYGSHKGYGENGKRFDVIHGFNNLGVKGENFEVMFSYLSGGLTSYRYEGVELMKGNIRPNFWRAPVDDDYGNCMPYRYAQWKIASLYAGNRYRAHDVSDVNHFCIPELLSESESHVTIRFEYRMPTCPESSCFLTYTVWATGEVTTRLTYDPIPELHDMPEFGVILKLSADYHRLRWFGPGPEETYADRKSGSKTSVYEAEVADLPEYLMPQECGNHADVKLAAVLNEEGRGLRFSGDFYISALPYTPHELEHAGHPFDLPEVHYTYVRLSLMQMGVGGDDAWGALTHPEFLINVEKPLDFTFSFRGVGSGS